MDVTDPMKAVDPGLANGEEYEEWNRVEEMIECLPSCRFRGRACRERETDI